MVIRLDRDKSRHKPGFNELDFPVICESDSLSCSDLFSKDGRIFVIVSSKKDSAIAERISINPDPADSDYEHNITCPVCGNIDEDSWEHTSDSSESYDCGRCGAVLSYQREITVEYSTSVVKMPEIKKID